MDEAIVITVGNCPENAWRRENLLKCRHVIETETSWNVSFSYVEGSNIPKSVKLTYVILK